MNTIGWWFESLDRRRKFHGRLLDATGFGPRESAYQIVYARPGARLRRYEGSTPGGPGLLIVPAPIKRPYIWDLCPERSVVRRAMARGYDVYLVEWTEPDMGGALGLEDYAATILDACLDAIAARSRSSAILVAGHSLGGTLAALYCAYRPKRVAGLVLVEAPLHFAEASGVFRPLLKQGIPAKAIVPSFGRVPGSMLSLISGSAAPATIYLERYFDHMASLGSREDLITHWRVERWTLDEFPLPQQLFEDVVEKLYREDRFMRGELLLGGKALRPSQVTAPIFAIYEPASRIIPPESILGFLHAAGSRNKALQPYFGDVGIALQHVGALVGDSAHREVWPRVFDWLERIGER
jgi:polyhydroxyalkanoate synthase